jgi:hypothetical protein
VKRFVSLQFLNLKTVGRTPWTGDQSVPRPLPTQTQNKRIHATMSSMGFEPKVPVMERAKTFHALDRAATVFGRTNTTEGKFAVYHVFPISSVRICYLE